MKYQCYLLNTEYKGVIISLVNFIRFVLLIDKNLIV